MRNLKPIYVSLGLSALLWSCAANAAATRFFCSTEAAADAIAEEIVVTDDGGVAKKLLDDGTCFYFPAEIDVNIVYHGHVFSKKLKVEVVGFYGTNDPHPDPAKEKLLYGLKLLETYKDAL